MVDHGSSWSSMVKHGFWLCFVKWHHGQISPGWLYSFRFIGYVSKHSHTIIWMDLHALVDVPLLFSIIMTLIHI